MPYGLTVDGFVRKPKNEILGDTNARQRDAFGDEWDTSAAAPDGIMNGIDASQKDELWALAEGVHASFDPSRATGASLDALCELTGVRRRNATRSVAPGTANLDPSTSVAAQALVVSVAGNPSARFRNRVAIENLGVGADDIPVIWEAVETGPVVANTGTLTEIETPTAGVNSVTSTADAVIGRNVETTEELRLRRVAEQSAQGGAVEKAIKADLLKLDGVEQVLVYQNRTNATVDGIPPHAVECVVFGGDDAEVAQSVFDSPAAGIATHGNTTLSAVDSEGATQPVKFTRPTELTVYLEIDLDVDSGYVGDAAVKQAVALYGNASFDVGADVVLARLYATIFAQSGVLDITEIRAGFTASPSGTVNLAVGTRQIARFDTARVVVNS